ncbi:hypothetical protein [Lentzea aerocolonigenes]|uniref:hypothetical protein n=1 Tax=Lentzea aerocolonigenes TaxID=68170 RepID=UPI0004C3264F|nr:hypothetical protein [Lentzea aerocolonigenes]MCP2243306.1 hypothetical protein [Lentzea aerocolonigenes]
MSTKADFFDGSGDQAVWLGSLQGDADPDIIRTVACGRLALDAIDPVTYADAVTDLLDVWDDEDFGYGYHPRDGWPWLQPDSRHTDWVFIFTDGQVQIMAGRAWSAPRRSIGTTP